MWKQNPAAPVAERRWDTGLRGRLSWRVTWALLALWMGGMVGPARAQDAGGTLVLALYAPMAPLPSADARFAFVDKLSRHLQSAGLSVQPKVFARAADLDAAIKRGQVDLAILDAFYLADRGANYTVLAVSTAAGTNAAGRTT